MSAISELCRAAADLRFAIETINQPERGVPNLVATSCSDGAQRSPYRRLLSFICARHCARLRRCKH